MAAANLTGSSENLSAEQIQRDVGLPNERIEAKLSRDVISAHVENTEGIPRNGALMRVCPPGRQGTQRFARENQCASLSPFSAPGELLSAIIGAV